MLLSRLQSTFGVSGDALSWFASYETGRTQSVKIDSVMFKEIVLKCCVFPGSILGPQLDCDYTILHSTCMQMILNYISLYNQILRKTN